MSSNAIVFSAALQDKKPFHEDEIPPWPMAFHCLYSSRILGLADVSVEVAEAILTVGLFVRCSVLDDRVGIALNDRVLAK